METPSNGGDPAQRAHDLGQQIAAGILAETKARQTSELAKLGSISLEWFRWGVTTFFVPFVALYAWGGLVPEAWVDLGYWPLVAGFYVFRHLVSWARGKSPFASGDAT